MLRNRHGVGVLAVPTHALSKSELERLLTFNFAQYLAAGFIDRHLAHNRGLQHEPTDEIDPNTVHFIAFSSVDGLLLASLAVQPISTRRPSPRLASRDRPLLPLEEHFGWGVFNRCALLPDMPIDRVREFGRFVRNSRLGFQRSLGARAVVELCYAASRALMGPLRMTIDAFVGEFEDNGIRPRLEFFHTPLAILRGGLPVFAGEHLLQPALTGHDRHPFAVLVSDMQTMCQRLDDIEHALEQPGDRALTALNSIPSRATSSLIPEGGLPELCDTPILQSELPVPERRALRARGARLRLSRPFTTLSDLEATTLVILMQTRQVATDEAVITCGELSDCLYVIDRGLVETRGETGADRTLSAGECFGVEGLLTGARASATIVARCPTTLWCLRRDIYRRYVRELEDIDLELHRLALATAPLGALPKRRYASA
jgi:CRP-like cAMP-binding protein